MEPRMCPRLGAAFAGALVLAGAGARWSGARAEGKPVTRVYENRLTPLKNPPPLLADHPEFIEPVREETRFEAPVLVDDPGADLEVRAWRFSYNARGIIEMPNRLRARDTAVLVVHPWGIDDGRGWRSPEPAGVAFACTPNKNRLAREHARKVIDPFLKSLRGKVGLVAYTLPGTEDAIRKQLYRSVHGRPSEADRQAGEGLLRKQLQSLSYRGGPVPARLELASERTVADYFRQFPGLDSGDRYNGAGFWTQPIPVMREIETAPDDVVIYDGDGYPVLRQFFREQGIRHVLLAGYHCDMCVKSTCGGYVNLSPDFNVFLVGDATQATFPANQSPRFAANAAVSFASLTQLITQVSWVRPIQASRAR